MVVNVTIKFVIIKCIITLIKMDRGKYNKAFLNYLMSIECCNYDFTNERSKTRFYND